MKSKAEKAEHDAAVRSIADQLILYRIKRPEITDEQLAMKLYLSQMAICKQKGFEAEPAFMHCQMAAVIIREALAATKAIAIKN